VNAHVAAVLPGVSVSVNTGLGQLHLLRYRADAGVGTRLLCAAAEWLDLGGVALLLAYATPEQEDMRALLAACRFRELTRTRRAWTRASR
jgi:hypothetical protein